MPNNEEIEEGPKDQNKEEEPSDQNQVENKEEEQKPQNEEEEPKVEDAANKAYEQEENAAVIRSQNQNAQEPQEQEEKNENENEQYEQQANEAEQAEQEQEIEQQDQEQEVEQQEQEVEQQEQEVEQQEQELPQEKVLDVEQKLAEPQDKIILRQQEEEVPIQEVSPKEDYARREIVQEEQLQQQPLDHYNEQKNYEVDLHNINYQESNNYNEIMDNNAISQINYVNKESIPIPSQNINITTTTNAQPITNTVVHPTITTTNVQAPIVFKDAEELNKYFESIGTKAYNQVVSSTDNISTNINNLDYNNINTDTNEEDLNKYFQPNAYTQNNNFDLASLGLQTNTTLQGASSEEEINKYFQGSGNTYNTGNAEINQYQYGTNSQTQNIEGVNYSEYKATSSKQSFNYNY